MLFNSLDFGLFLLIVTTVYSVIPRSARWVLMLAASYFFYMYWRAEYIVLIILSTLVDYVASIKIGESSSSRIRKLWLAASLTANLGLLGFFKYYNFFITDYPLIHERVTGLVSCYGSTYHDYNLRNHSGEIVDRSHYMDENHMNGKGADRFSAIFARELLLIK